MGTLNVLICLFFMTVLMVECQQDNVPDIYYSCTPESLLVTASFPKPFHGTVFAQEYYAVPKCSTPNMAAAITQEVKLNLPLLNCGTKVRRRNRSLVENTIVIQYHPILTTVFDYSLNITCRLKERLPISFWDLYREREQKPHTKFDSWVEFKLGNKVFGEIESQLLGVSDKWFLLVYVKDGGKNKHLLVDKCLVHNERIVNEKTKVDVLSQAERCPADSLSEFSLRANSSVSDLVAFAEVQAINVPLKGGFFITCALEMCEQVCPQPCKYGMEISRWNDVSTHKLLKRSLEIPDQVLDGSGTKKSLKSSVKALTTKLRSLRLMQLARRRENELKESKETEQSINTTPTFSESFTESTLPKLNRQGRIYSLKLDMPVEDPKLTNLTEDTSNATPESTSNATTCSDCMPTVVENVEEDFQNKSQTNTSQTDGTLYSQELLSNTSATPNISISNDLNYFEKIYLNDTEPYSNATSNCVPKLKFVSVTASLSVLTVCFFLICIGLILHLRKERKKHLLDSYLLYNFF